MTELTDDERRVLDIEGQRWRFDGAKAEAVRNLTGRTLTRHYQLVNALIDRPEALVYAPVTVRRLQRLQEQHRRLRSKSRPALYRP